jgi:hypothetical protein
MTLDAYEQMKKEEERLLSLGIDPRTINLINSGVTGGIFKPGSDTRENAENNKMEIIIRVSVTAVLIFIGLKVFKII